MKLIIAHFLPLLLGLSVISFPESILANPLQVQKPYVNTNVEEEESLPDPACDSDKFQQIVFHHEWDLTGDSQEFCSNQKDIQSTPGHAKTSKHFCVNRGVWVVQATYNGSSNQQSILLSSNIGWLCVGFPENWNIKYNSARYLSSANLSSSALSLYTERWRGLEFRFDGNEIKLPSPIPVSTYALTGLEQFTIYEGTDFDGETECILPGRNNPYLLGVSFFDNMKVKTVGSVQKGCQIHVAASAINRLKGIVSSSNDLRIQAAPELLAQMTVRHL